MLERSLTAKLCSDIASAVAHLHEKGIVHRDLKPGNILLNDDLSRAKLSDFGSSRRRSNHSITTTTVRAGTFMYMAPEVLHNVKCRTSRAWDSWSFGIVMCELLNTSGRELYMSEQHRDICKAARNWADGIEDIHHRQIAGLCLRGEPGDRATMKMVSLHLDGVLSSSDIPVTEDLSTKRPANSIDNGLVKRESNVEESVVSTLSNSKDVIGKVEVEHVPHGQGLSALVEQHSQSSAPQLELPGGTREEHISGTSDGLGLIQIMSRSSRSTASTTGDSMLSLSTLHAESQQVSKRGWLSFRDVKNRHKSGMADVTVENGSSLDVALFKIIDGGQHEKLVTVRAGEQQVVYKKGEDGGVTLILKEEMSQIIRTVLCIKRSGTKRIVITNESLSISSAVDWNEKIWSSMFWPMASVVSGRSASILIRNDFFYGFSVNKLDRRGQEHFFLERVKFNSEVRARADTGTMLVFRNFGTFLYAALVPDVPQFRMQFD